MEAYRDLPGRKGSTTSTRRWIRQKSRGFPLGAAGYKPEVVSFWRTSQWKALRDLEDLKLIEVNQGDYGGAAVKPTGLGTDLDIEPGRLAGADPH